MALGHCNVVLAIMMLESSRAAVSLMRGSSWTLDTGTIAANCSSTRCSSCNVTWGKDGDPTFHLANETLFLNPVKKTNRGNYTCTVEDGEGRQWNNGTLEILVYYPTENISLSVNSHPYSKTYYKTQEGANVTLSCSVDGFPPPLVKWHKDGGVVKTDNLTQKYGLHQHPENSFLTSYHVTDAGCEDEGAYVCQAGNGVMDAVPIEKYIMLEVELGITMALGHCNVVLAIMMLESSRAAVSLMRGSSWTLDTGTIAANCSSTRCSSCNVTWGKDGDPTFHLANETLFLNPVKKTNRGNYTCTVEDGEGRQWNNGTLEILVYYPTENISLSVNSHPYSKTYYKTQEGANVTLSCSVNGFPPPLVKWHKDGGVVKTDNLTQKYGLHQHPENSFLTSYHVTDAGCEDEGAYVCQAGNGVMDAVPIEKYIMLEVECAPKVQHSAKYTWTWSVRRGDTVLASFTVLSNPLSSVITWWRTGEDTSREILNEGDTDHSLNETVLNGNARYIALSHYNVTETGQYGITLANGHPPNLTVTYTVRVDKGVLTNPSEAGSGMADCADTVCMYRSYIIGGCVALAACAIAAVVVIAVLCYRRTDRAKDPVQDSDLFRVLDDIFPPMSPPGAWNKNSLDYSCNSTISSIYRETHPTTMTLVCRASVFFVAFIGSHSGEVLLTEDSPWTIAAGTNASVTCGHTNSTNYTVSWGRQEHPQFTSDNATLRFLNTQVTDYGNYTCFIEVDDTVRDNKTLEIRVSYPPGNISVSLTNRHETRTNYTISAGDNTTLVCSVDGFPPPLITWKKDDAIVKEENLTDRYGFHQSPTDNCFNSVFNVINAWRDDSGTYTCTASNSANQNDSLHLEVHLEVPKYFPALQNESVPPQTYTVVEGESVVINFTVVSRPESLVAKWSLHTNENDISLFLMKGNDSAWYRKNRTISTDIQLFEFHHVNVTTNMAGLYSITLTNGLRRNLDLDYNISLGYDSPDSTVESFTTAEVYNNTTDEKVTEAYCDSTCKMLWCLIVGIFIGAVLFLVLLSFCLRAVCASIMRHPSLEDIFSELDDSIATIKHSATESAQVLHPIAPQYTFRETNYVSEC
ncbi:hemicentin-2-like [Haliotis asinina]|uniref:hemicentin-2-like n=1 Tax=Haliotis asinina TaxID=109174 RepID=UPI0035326EEC